MTAPTIPPQQPEPERVCGNCEFYRGDQDSPNLIRGTCFVQQWLPPCIETTGYAAVLATDTCVLFRARKES